jgi:polysaccharide export outer membrane protein
VSSAPHGAFPYAPALRRSRSRGLALVLAAVLALGAGQAQAAYRLAPGDTVEVAVAGLPELKQRAPIQLDGTISIPAIGTLQVAGATPAEVQAQIEAALSTRPLRQRSSDGRERPALILPGDVAVTVAEYRPVFVGGDVHNPGQYPFRPLMSVRHALALAGGPSLVRGRAAAAQTDAVDLEREYRTLVVELAKDHVRAWRLAAEIEGQDSLKERPLEGFSVAPGTLAGLVRLEARSLQVAQAEYRKELAYLADAARQAEAQAAVLAVQEQEEQRGVQADVEELEKTNKLFGGGNLTSQRVSENRRAVLLSSTRRLQTAASLTEVRQRREEYLWRRQKLESQRELQLLRDIKDTRARIAELQTRLDGTVEKLSLFGRARFQTLSEGRPAAEFTILRREGSAWTKLPADEDAELQPGDGVEVLLPAGHAGPPAVR